LKPRPGSVSSPTTWSGADTIHSARTRQPANLGLADIVLFGVGGIVGAGIYAIIGEGAGYGGTLLWVSFLMAALVAFLTAGSYAELVSRFPDAGGSFEYVKQAPSGSAGQRSPASPCCSR
jgi:amino acid transporter